MIIDFGTNKINSWVALTDQVMGGQSQGSASYEQDVLQFKGTVSFENNGGFSSVRSNYNPLDLSGYQTVTVRYRCVNQSLTLNFNHYREWYLPNYKALLPETEMKWKTIEVPLVELKEYRIGKATGQNVTKDKLTRIIRLGIMTGDKKEGEFEAEIDFIRFD